jgi:hypothetical protein
MNDSKFVVIDISAPQNPRIKAVLSHGSGGAVLSQPMGVFVQGNYAFVASQGSNALEIIDITNPLTPLHKGKILNNAGGADLSFARDVVVAGNYAYVASRSALEIVNVTDKALPVHHAKVSVPNAMCLAVAGRYVYMGGFGTFSVVDLGADLNNPTPTVLTTVFNGGSFLIHETNTVEVVGNYAFFTSGMHNSLEILDISTPSAPTHAASLVNDEDGAIIEEPRAVTISGNYAYVLSGHSASTIAIVDISNPLAPDHIVSATTESHGLQMIQGQRIAVVGNFAYTTSTPGLEVDYIFTPTPPIPQDPTNVTQSGLQLNWKPMPAIDNFTLDVATDADMTSFLPGYNGLSIPAASNFAVLTGLSAGTTYYYRVKATNNNGTSAYSAVEEAQTTPGALSNLAFVSSTFDGFTVGWDAMPGAAYSYQ